MQTKNMLDQIYDLFQERIDYRIDEIEIKQTRRRIMEIAETAGIMYDKLEYAVIDCNIAYERAGFRNGFRIAVQILSECLNTIPIPDNIPGSDPTPDTPPSET